MIFPDHPAFEPPSDASVGLWRYMDLPRLISILASKTLWFARADTLGDPHEGSFGPFNASMRPDVYATLPPHVIENFSHIHKSMVKRMHVSCWHMANEESVAMWRAYATAGQAVAIRTRYDLLRDGLSSSEDIFGGVVRYVDKKTTWIPEDNLYWPFIHKRLSFAYENEFRAIISKIPVGSGDPPAADLTIPAVPGVKVDVDTGKLIEAVYVGPDQPSWFKESVEVVVEKLCPGRPVRQSDLEEDPIY